MSGNVSDKELSISEKLDREFEVTPKNRTSFRATMILAAIYSGMIVAFLLFANLTPAGRGVTEQFYTFSMTMVLGMLSIVLLMAFLLLKRDPWRLQGPSKIDLLQAEYKCPDFYTLQREDRSWVDQNINGGLAPTYGNKLQYRCVPQDPEIFGQGHQNLRLMTSNMPADVPTRQVGSTLFVNSTKPTPFSEFVSKNQGLYKSRAGGNQPVCGEIFPEYILDGEATDPETKKKKADIRCAYAAACGTQWSSLGC